MSDTEKKMLEMAKDISNYCRDRQNCSNCIFCEKSENPNSWCTIYRVPARWAEHIEKKESDDMREELDSLRAENAKLREKTVGDAIDTFCKPRWAPEFLRLPHGSYMRKYEARVLPMYIRVSDIAAVKFEVEERMDTYVIKLFMRHKPFQITLLYTCEEHDMWVEAMRCVEEALGATRTEESR